MSDEEEKKKVVQKRFGATVPGAWGTMCIRCDYSGKTHAAMMRAGIAANSTRAEQDRLRELKSKENAKLKLFSQNDLDRLRRYICKNTQKKGDYGLKPDDRHDCITAIRYGLPRLLFDEAIESERKEMSKMIEYLEQGLKGMDKMMGCLKSKRYAEDGTTFDFDCDSKLGRYIPVNYRDSDGSLSEIAKRCIGFSDDGYYILGMSIMHGAHSAILAINMENNDATFNIFDQNGSLVGQRASLLLGLLEEPTQSEKPPLEKLQMSNILKVLGVSEQSETITTLKKVVGDSVSERLNCWYDANVLNAAFLRYVANGHRMYNKETREFKGYGQTDTTLYPIYKQPYK